MRHSLPRAALVAGVLLLGTAPLAADGAPKRPVQAPAAPAAEAPAPAEEAPAPEAPAAPSAKRPLVAPGTKIEALPQLAPMTPEERAKKDGPAAPDAPPPPPPEFLGLPATTQAEAAPAPKGAVADPAEARSSLRADEFQYVFSVKPGRPKAGTPVEVTWKIQEILHIPDPFLGDRKPATGANLVATVSGPEKARTFEVHPVGAATSGVYGLHFTPSANGAYEIQLARADGKAGHKVKFTAYVGVEPPAQSTALRGVNDRAEELIAGKGPDDRSIEGVMKELGKRWMALERAAGTPKAQAAVDELQAQVAKVAGKAPRRHDAHAIEFDELARLLEGRTAKLTGDVPRAAALSELQDVQEQACLRCHVRFRFGLADGVRNWPAFEEKKDLDQASPRDRANAPRGRGPVGPAR